MPKFFTITGEYITRQVRDWWTEGKHESALKLLRDGCPALTEDERMGIILGRYKITGENDNCNLEPDGVNTHRGQPLLTLEALLTQEKTRTEDLKLDKRVEREWNAEDTVGCSGPYGLVQVPRILVRWNSRSEVGSPVEIPYPEMGWEKLAARYPWLIEAAKDAQAFLRSVQGRPDPEAVHREVCRRTGVSEAMVEAMAPTIAAVMERPKADGPPAPDKAMESLNGWLSPEGKFYPCGFFGHLALADTLSPNGEVGLERAWVRIQDSHDNRVAIARPIYPGSDFQHIPERGVTQAQLNAMQAWCQRHGRELPPNLDVR